MSLFSVEKKTMLLEGIEFNTLSIGSKEKFDEYNFSNDYENVVWENCFGFIYPYAKSREKTCSTLWKVIDGFLCVFEYKHRTNRILLNGMPLSIGGKKKLSAVIPSIMEILRKINGKHKNEMYYIVRDRVSSKKIVDVLDNEKVKLSADFSDFVFKVEDLINLPGGAYQKRRNMVNRFKRDNPNHTIRPATTDDFDEILALRKQWVETKLGKKEDVWDKNMFPHELKNYDKIGGRLMVCEIENKIKGFLSLFPLCKDTFIVMTRNSDNDVKGLAEFLWYECLRHNQDLGSLENDGNAGAKTNGLYHYKMDHMPVALIDKCTIIDK